MYKLIAGLILCVPVAAIAQEEAPRSRPLTATMIGVCENHAPVLGVALFTYADGHTLIVTAGSMQGFRDLGEIAAYAATAERLNEFHQVCGDTSA